MGLVVVRLGSMVMNIVVEQSVYKPKEKTIGQLKDTLMTFKVVLQWYRARH